MERCKKAVFRKSIKIKNSYPIVLLLILILYGGSVVANRDVIDLDFIIDLSSTARKAEEAAGCNGSVPVALFIDCGRVCGLSGRRRTRRMARERADRSVWPTDPTAGKAGVRPVWAGVRNETDDL